MKKRVVVVGAGIVGTCCALSLAERGFSVVIVDPNGPTSLASHGNAGVVSRWTCVPQSTPGILKQVPGWLFDPYGPVAIRWRYLPRS